MKKTLIAILGIVMLSSCQRACNRMDRKFQTSNRNYQIEQYSGGRLIATYKFIGIVNNQENSDGYYWYQGDSLVEVSGDIILKSWK